MVKLTEKLVLARARSRSLGAVKNLNCWGSGLSDVSVVKKMHNIEVINASTNDIESLQAFSHCCNLRELYLRKNALKNLNEVLHLKDLSELRILWLSDNPCCENISKEKYRLTVIKALPMLSKLDNITITSMELEQAKKEGDDLTKPEAVSLIEEVMKEKSIPVNCFHTKEPEENNADSNSSERTVKEPNDFSPEKKEEISYGTNEEDTKNSGVDETNELRKELGLKPLPQISCLPPVRAVHHQPTLAQSSTSINVLAATLSLVKELDEEGLRTLQDAIQDRIHMLQREESLNSLVQENCDASGSTNFSNGSITSIDKKSMPQFV